MVEVNIVIIDSGLDHCYQNENNIKGGICFKQNEHGDIVTNNNFDDKFGHGTAIYSIINKECQGITFYFVKIFDETPECDQELLLHSLRFVCKHIKCDFVLLSSGTVVLRNIEEFDGITKELYENKECVIVAAFNNEGALSYPAAGEFVIGIDSSPNVNAKDSHYIVKGSPVDILCSQRSYRVTWLNGNKLIQKGNSYSAAFFTAKLYNAFKQIGIKDKNELLKYTKNNSNEIVFQKPCFEKILNPEYLSKNCKLRAIAFPFSKEIKTLAANENLLQNIKIVGYYDVRERGEIGLKISDILGYSENKKLIRCIDLIEQFDDYDLIICGHLDVLSQLTGNDWRKKLKEIAQRKGKKLYFFDYDVDRTQRDIYSPPSILKYNGNCFGKMWHITAPVVGVFGTSSIQGKFSLQLKLRERFINDGYKLRQLSTEPTGALFGMDFVCSIGYNSSIKLSRNDAAKFYNQLLHECDKCCPDIILIGSQSATIPHNSYHEQYLTFQQIEFLFGTNPDAVILVINEFDDQTYINRTIKFIESSINTKE